MPSDNSLLCLILEFQVRSLYVQQLLQAESAKEYDADWLPEAKKVMRDGTGKFAKKGASITQSIQDTTAILKQGFDLTGDTIQSMVKDPEFRKRAGIATGLPMAKLISNLATQARLNPKLTEKLDEWIANATKEFADQYGDDKSPMAQAIRKGNLAQLPKDASLNEKMEFRVAQYAAYKEALDSPEDFSKRDEIIGKAATAAIPIGVSLAIALGFEVAIPLFLAQSVNWATVLSSVALGEAADFAIQKGMDKLEINNPALRIGASMVAGILAGGLVTGVNNKFLVKQGNKSVKTLEKQQAESLVEKEARELAERDTQELMEREAKEKAEREVKELAEKQVKKEALEKLTENSTEEVYARSSPLGKADFHWRKIEDSTSSLGFPKNIEERFVPKKNGGLGTIEYLINYDKPSVLIHCNPNGITLQVSGIEAKEKHSERLQSTVYNALSWVVSKNKYDVISEDKDLMLRHLMARSLLSFLGKDPDFIDTVNDSITYKGLEAFTVNSTKINQLIKTSEEKLKQLLPDLDKVKNSKQTWDKENGDIIDEDGVLDFVKNIIKNGLPQDDKLTFLISKVDNENSVKITKILRK
jgi:hypothetical protein